MKGTVLKYIFLVLTVLISTVSLVAKESKTTPLNEQQQAIHDSLLEVLNDYGTDTNAVNTYLQLHLLWRINHTDTGIYFANKAIEIAEEIEYNKGLMNAHLYIGIIRYKTDKYNDALKSFIESHKYAEAMGNYKKVLSLCNNISVISMAQADYNKALEYTQKMLAINKKYVNDPKSACNGNTNLGIVMREQGNYRESLSFYRKALDYAIEHKLKLKDGTILDGMGQCYHELGILDSAKISYEQALEARRRDGHIHGEASTLGNVAKVYIEEGNLKMALKRLNLALKIYEEDDLMIQMAKTKLTIADVKIKQNNGNEAVNLLLKAVPIFEEEDAKAELKEAYKLLGMAYSKVGNHKEAYSYEQKFGAMKDSIYSDEMSKQLALMHSEFELDKQQEKIKAEKTFKRWMWIGFGVFFILVIIIFKIIYDQYQIKKRSNEILQKQKEEILERNAEINAQKEELSAQRDQLEVLNEDITASIRYAKRLQDAILPPDSYIQHTLKDAFVLFKPKDIVSGDFYWVHHIGKHAIYAVVDCTGHGVPGAFMSLVGNDALNLAIADMEEPKASKILNYLNLEVTKRLHQDSEGNTVKDGMDIALCSINMETLEMQFAGAYNPVYIIRNKEIIEIKGDPFAIGMFVGEEVRPFTNQKFQLEKGDVIYTFSDGFADQFGGPKGKKFKYKPFKQILIDNVDKPLSEQKAILNQRFEEWMVWEGRPVEPQIDDVCIMGVRV